MTLKKFLLFLALMLTFLASNMIDTGTCTVCTVCNIVCIMFLHTGIVSLVSFAILSLERYSTMLCYTKADVSDYRKAWLSIGGCWLYSLAWTLPPLFGWSSYGPEGPGTTCSVQWHQRSPGNVAYVTCLFIFCLLLPLVLMVYCYGKILIAIRGVRVPSGLNDVAKEDN